MKLATSPVLLSHRATGCAYDARPTLKGSPKISFFVSSRTPGPIRVSCSHLSSASHGSPELEKLKLKDSELERGAWIRSSREKRPMDMKENLRELAAAIVFVYLDSGENGVRWPSY